MESLKKLFCISILVSLVVGCSDADPVPLESSSSYEDLQSSFNKHGATISMSTSQENYKKPLKEIILTIENTGNTSVGIRSGPYMEKSQNGEWYQVPYENFAFTDGEGPGIEPGKIYEQDVPLEYINFDLSEGKYRIVKDFLVQSEEITLAAEFNIQ